MTNLEFINKEIKFLEDMINMDLALMEDEEDLEEIADKQKILSHYQQIKTDLEAWEVVKQYVKEISINGIVFEHIINVSHTKQNYDIVKKALEVDDVKN